MPVELYHVFICTGVGAPEADLLAALGLTEGTPNTHHGQGTANRRFFFGNAMLELLWISDEREARSPPIAPTRLWERWRSYSTGYSPFGVCLRPKTGNTPVLQATLPFATWKYRPPYLSPGTHIEIVADTAKGEPMLFVTPFGGRPDTAPEGRREPFIHPLGAGEISCVRITLPSGEHMSDPLRTLNQTGIVSFVAGNEHLAEIEFDHARRNEEADFRPALPLRFCW